MFSWLRSLGSVCSCAVFLCAGLKVEAASTNGLARVLYGGRSPALLSKRGVAPLGALTKGHRPQSRVELPSLSAAEWDYIQKQEAADHQKRLRIGIGRPLSNAIAINPATAPEAQWTTRTNGQRIWTIHITSHGALGLRLHLEGLALDPRVTIVTYNPFSPEATIAPVPCDKPDPEIGVWTPTVFGEDAVVECQAPVGVDLSSVRLSVTGVSHQYRGLSPQPKSASPCEHDISCQLAWKRYASGVARIDFTDHAGNGFACSGCLIASHDSAANPNYFLTAHHCIGSESLASTIESTWLWYDTSCDNTGTDNGGTLVIGGADLLATSSSSDFALVQLRDSPPYGVQAQDWSTNLLSSGEAVAGIHYPYPDPEKISFGNETDFDSSFWYLQWNYGITEPGSSGSPLFNSQHQIVGQLYGGTSACDNTTGMDQYGRFDQTYPMVKKWLDSFPFVRLGGNYSGLFSDSGTPANQSSGFFSLNLRSEGAYSGKLRVARKNYSFSGAFDQSGAGSNQIPTAGAMLTLQMSLDTTPGAESITGTITTGSWTAGLLAKRAAFDSKTNPAPFASRYTVVLPGGNSSDVPRGYGFATLTINASGHAHLAGTSGDGTGFSQSTVVFPDNTLPLFANLYGGNGALSAWLSFSGGPPADTIGGAMSWVKDPFPNAKLYPLGFSLSANVRGETYQPPASGMQVISLSSATVAFSGGNLASDFSNDITISPNNRVTTDSANRLSMSFSAGTGRFNGSVTPPLGGTGLQYHGITLQGVSLGFGYFLGPTESGSVELQ